MRRRVAVFIGRQLMRAFDLGRMTLDVVINRRLQEARGRDPWVIVERNTDLCGDTWLRFERRARWWESAGPALYWCKCGAIAFLLPEPVTYARADMCERCGCGPYSRKRYDRSRYDGDHLNEQSVGTCREDLAEIDAFANELSEMLGGVVFAKVDGRYPSIIHALERDEGNRK